jgi:hypothetical protein
MFDRDSHNIYNNYRTKIILENSFFNNSSSSNFNIGPVYHGGGWNGTTAPFIRDGSYGTGIYFTDSYNEAKKYATDEDWRDLQSVYGKGKRKGTYIVEAFLNINNPLIREDENDYMFILNSLIEFGWSKKKADDKINKQFENTGNIGSFFKKEAIKKGYDGLVHKKNIDIYVCFNPHQVKVTNVEEL